MQFVTGPGHLVAGRYQLLDLIGRGAMGTVWRARDLALQRDVAVKHVRASELMSEQERKVLHERSLREAKVAARLNHPGIVTVYDVLEADGTPWIVLELITARSLAHVLAQDGPLSPCHAAGLGTMLVAALASAHEAGVLHRDVKPANVLLTGDGRTVLTDFGIATLDGDPALTQAGMVMGTPGFCAPERIRGSAASPASDLWSVGATLYAAVEGRGPFDGNGPPMAVLASIVHGEIPPAPSAGPLGPVISALMDRDPARRPGAAAAGRLLAAAAQPPGALPRPAGAVEPGFLGGHPFWPGPDGAAAAGHEATLGLPVAGADPAPAGEDPESAGPAAARPPGRHRRILRLRGGGAPAT